MIFKVNLFSHDCIDAKKIKLLNSKASTIEKYYLNKRQLNAVFLSL